MKTLITRFTLLTVVLLLTINATTAQKTYQQMTADEQQTFVTEQSARIAKAISSRDYAFTPEYLAQIKQHVDVYAKRVGNNKTEAWRGDVRLVLERGQQYVPMIAKSFEANGVSPIIGIYLPMIEAEYRNDLTSSMGATGMFQFLAQTAKQFGLTPEERTDTAKAANAAARFLSELQNQFAGNSMKEGLALTSYNQGPKAVKESLSIAVNEQNKSCSLCALNENRAQLNQSMQTEGLKYALTFFAAAIIGENPESFGMKLNPLSSYTKVN